MRQSEPSVQEGSAEGANFTARCLGFLNLEEALWLARASERVRGEL